MQHDLDAGRRFFEGSDWTAARSAFLAIGDDALDAEDLERLAVTELMLGLDEAWAGSWERAHRAHLRDGRPDEAARCACWLATALMMRGLEAQASGWFGRAATIVEQLDHAEPCAAAGFLEIPPMLMALDQGAPEIVAAHADKAANIGAATGDRDLTALAQLGQGQAIIRDGRRDEGLAKLDEVMVSVTTGEVGPITSGIAYCVVIAECMDCLDIPRAAEWTSALSTWCDAQTDLVPFRGQCLIHRSQIEQAAGRWTEAVTSASSACDRLRQPPHPALGLAHYQLGELSRLRGDWEQAEEDYRRAAHHGHEPLPGLALLALDRGRVDEAADLIRTHIDGPAPAAPPALSAAVRILLAAANTGAARSAAEALAAEVGGDCLMIEALSEDARGLVLADPDPRAAIGHFRAAAERWQRLQMPYERARTSMATASCFASVGDVQSARLEVDAARDHFRSLGARVDLARADTLAREVGLEVVDEPTPSEGSLLSDRELEVLSHVAAGRTNRQIAGELVISAHTVRRHLENIFAKLGVSSRAAATAWAYEHGVVGRPPE